MGILSALLGEKNPAAQWAGQNQNFLAAIGGGLGQGQNIQSGLSAGLAQMPQAKMLDAQAAEKAKADAKVAAQLSATESWMEVNHPDIAQMIKAGMPLAEGWQLAMDRMQPQAPADPIKGIEINGRLVNPVTGQEMGNFSDPAQPNLPAPPAGYRWNADGSAVEPIVGAPPPVAPIDPAKVAYESAAAAARGKADAEVQASIADLQSKLPGLKSVVEDLNKLGEKATYTLNDQFWDEVTKQQGKPLPERAIARTSYIAMVDNQVLPLLRETFGAAFTAKEGETLRATLGDPNLSPAQKKAVLDTFIAQKIRNLEALQSRPTGYDAQGSGGNSGDGWTVLGVE